MRVPRWVTLSSLVLCVLGLAVSAYLTYEHFSSNATLACPATSSINCEKVTSSSYSKFLGMPVALLGLLYFVGMTVLCLPQLWAHRAKVVHNLRLLGVVLGVIGVVYLVWAELYRIDAICLWCTVIHVATFALFVVIALGMALREDDRPLAPDRRSPARR